MKASALRTWLRAERAADNRGRYGQLLEEYHAANPPEPHLPMDVWFDIVGAEIRHWYEAAVRRRNISSDIQGG